MEPTRYDLEAFYKCKFCTYMSGPKGLESTLQKVLLNETIYEAFKQEADGSLYKELGLDGTHRICHLFIVGSGMPSFSSFDARKAADALSTQKIMGTKMAQLALLNAFAGARRPESLKMMIEALRAKKDGKTVLVVATEVMKNAWMVEWKEMENRELCSPITVPMKANKSIR